MRDFGKIGSKKLFNATVDGFGYMRMGRRYVRTICLVNVWTDFKRAADHVWLTDNIGISESVKKGDKVCFYGRIGTYRGTDKAKKQNIFDITNFSVVARKKQEA